MATIYEGVGTSLGLSDANALSDALKVAFPGCSPRIEQVKVGVRGDKPTDWFVLLVPRKWHVRATDFRSGWDVGRRGV